MNPYREPQKPTSRLKQFFVNRVRRVTPATIFLAAVLIAGITMGATAALRLNGLKFGANDNSQWCTAYGCIGNNVADDSTAINSALTGASPGGTVYIPATTSGYNIGTTTINVPAGVELVGSSRGITSLHYSGTGCAVKFASTAESAMRHINVITSNAGAGVRGICLDNIAADNKFNVFENVRVRSTAGFPPTVGSIGVFFDGSGGAGHALYWNQMNHVEIDGYDKALSMLGSVGSANGPNANNFVDLMVSASTVGVSLEAYAGENTFFGLFCSASGYTGTDCVILGDGTNPTTSNALYGVTSDQGVGPRSYQLKAGAVGNYIQSSNQSSGADIDNGTNNTITLLGTFQSTSKVSKLNISQPAQTSGSPTLMSITGAAHTTLANAEFNDIAINLTNAAQITGGGTIAKMRNIIIQGRTAMAATSATTVSDASTLDIVNAPTCGTNMTCTRLWALYVESGNSNFQAIQATQGTFTSGAFVSSGTRFDSVTASATIGLADQNATTLNVGKAAAVVNVSSLLGVALPLKTNATIASATTIAPTQPATFISGTTTIQTITAPTNFAQTNGGGCIKLIPTGLWVTNTAGNIALATTAVVNKTLEECYDNATAKWYPSY